MCTATSSSARHATAPEALPPRLLRAYRLTRYCAAGVPIRIGHRVPDELFATLGARHATLVTAWNPRSRRTPAGRNRHMQRRLRQHLHRFAVAEAAGSLHRWREAMLLVAGEPAPVVRLARRF